MVDVLLGVWDGFVVVFGGSCGATVMGGGNRHFLVIVGLNVVS